MSGPETGLLVLGTFERVSKPDLFLSSVSSLPEEFRIPNYTWQAHYLFESFHPSLLFLFLLLVFFLMFFIVFILFCF